MAYTSTNPFGSLAPRCLLSCTGYLSCLFASFERHIVHSEANAYLLKEIIWRYSTGEDPDKVIGDFLTLSVDIEGYTVRFEFHGARVKKYLDLSGPAAFLESLRVA